MSSLIPQGRGYKQRLLFFYKNDFGIKHSAKVDMSLNKETEVTKFFGASIT